MLPAVEHKDKVRGARSQGTFAIKIISSSWSLSINKLPASQNWNWKTDVEFKERNSFDPKTSALL